MSKVNPFSLFGFLSVAYATYERVYYGDGILFVEGEAHWPKEFERNIAFADVTAAQTPEQVAETVNDYFNAFGINVAVVKPKEARGDDHHRPKAAGIGITEAGRGILQPPAATLTQLPVPELIGDGMVGEA